MPCLSFLKLPVTAVLLAAAVAVEAAPPVAASLESPKVRLWYQETGRLSGDISDQPNGLWNTIIGGGAAEEYANDALFTIEVRTQGQQNLTQPVVLTATGENGKVLARRAVRDGLTSEEGKMVAPLWVRDVGCAGPVTFTAQLGASRQAVRLNFNCGE